MTKALPRGRKATGPISAAFADDPFLYAYDLPDGVDVKVTIEQVEQHDRLDIAGNKHANVHVLRFVGKKKVLPLLAKKLVKAVAKIHGKSFDLWEGKPITLYVAEETNFGELQDVIRIRVPKRGRADRSAQDFLHGDDPGPDGFVDAGARGESTKTEPTKDATAALHGESPADDQMAFENAAHVAGLSQAESDELLADNDGNYKRAHDELAKRAGVDAGKLL